MARPAILTPAADLWLTGGLSVLVLLPLAFASSFVVNDVLEWVVVGTVVAALAYPLASLLLP